MNKYMKSVISALKHWVTSQKSDWNQNDPTAANFVKNRPFYESPEVLFDQRVEFEGGDWMQSELLPISAGDAVSVTFDGEQYECVAADMSEMIPGAVALGNLRDFSGEDTGEPFFIVIAPGMGTSIVLPYFDEDGYVTTSATIRIEKSVIHTIDPKYLPENNTSFNVNVWYENGEVGYLADKTYEQIKAAEEAKTPIVGTLTLHDGRVFTMIGCDSALPTVNLVAFNLNSTPDIGIYHVSIDENFTNIALFSITATQGGTSDIYPK